MRKAVSSRTLCFMSTPNLNFAIACLKDSAFRLSVLQSDLSLADGWPIVAYARLSGCRLPQRVAGSTLFDRIRASDVRPALSVYFFGGPDGAAEAACLQLQAENGGVSCAGFHTPGFGSIEEMSTPEQIDRINRARPDVLVLALGAKKGQAWIQRNLQQLEVPVVSHLGAVVNFVAGSIKRAPGWVQSAGLEWLWRVKEEPGLWRRYAGDGAALLGLLARRTFVWTRHRGLEDSDLAAQPSGQIITHRSDAGTTIVLSGRWVRQNTARLRDELAQLCGRRDHASIDMLGVTRLDSSSIGLMSLLYGWQLKINRDFKIAAFSDSAYRAIRLAHAEYLFDTAAGASQQTFSRVTR